MDFTFKSPNDELLISPVIEKVLGLISDVEDWGIGEVECKRNNAFYSQLIVIIEKPYGFILRYSPKDGSSEFVYRNPNNDEEGEISTFDGGDDWTVPICYVHPEPAVRKVVEHFLSTGDRLKPKNWGVLGVDL